MIRSAEAHRQERFAYDPVGNLVREHHASDLFGDRRSHVWHHEYDELGNRRRTVRPDGHVVDWLMYGSGHVHGMLLDGEERVQFERDDLHRETVRVLSSKVGQRTHYDPAGRVLQQTIQRSTSPAPLAERRYRYDAMGQLSRIEDSRKGGTDYRYDPVGRLIEAISPIAKERFAFDPASNIIDPVRTAETPASRPSPVRPESTLPVEVPKVLGNLLKAYAGMHFEYDARGNLVRKRTPAGEQEYEWDEFNRMLSARVAETSRQSQARYFYDAFGRRIAKEVNGERTVFGWDGDTLAYESDGERGTHYLYEPGTFVPLAQYVAGPVEGIATPVWTSTDRYVPEEDPLQKVPERRGDAAVFYYHCDQIGTPQLLTDDDGDVVWEASYKAWGEAREVIARASKAAGIVAKNSLRFQGQQVDAETGLHYNRHRYYDPAFGRFTSADPIGLTGGSNGYEYSANPVDSIDPRGLTADRLGRNLARAGRPLQPGQTPHHIVQENCRKSLPNSHVQKSREILERSDIDIDSASNGARLWGTGNAQVQVPGHPGRVAARADGTYHAGAHVHGTDNDKLIYQVLKGVEKRGGNVENALRDIGQRMENGSWKGTFSCCCD
ncbi:type IV secretion protein Rhs [Burkholderia sp. AU31280]|nr:type IV secretion protein Rhs [Burkholderia sp. AU31280]